MFQKYNEQCSLITVSETPYISFKVLEDYGEISAGFSTRLGGVSKDYQKSLNLGFQLEESRENVLENYRRITEALEIKPEQLVLTKQEHETNVLKVDKDDCGKGIFKERDYTSADGLITNEKGVALTVFGADCVPMIFYDHVNKVIATAHAGWRGTVGDIAGKTVEKFREEYGCEPKNIKVVIGPSICPDCYEVSSDVADRFLEKYPDAITKKHAVNEEYKTYSVLTKGKEGKYQLNLWLANHINLRAAGIKSENIYLGGMCTMCRQDLFFSHRGSGGKRGVMSGFIMLRDDDMSEAHSRT